MNTDLYPIRFQPVYQNYLWGGDRIPARYHRNLPPGIYAESWEVSDRDDGMGVVANGPLAGRTFRDLLEAHGESVLGSRVTGNRFPLLIKIIDARQTLSVQVHPDDDAAAAYGGEAKTEMWYILEGGEDAAVYCGFKDGVDEDQYRQAVEAGNVQDLLVRKDVEKGDVIFIRGGTVHAVGAGCMLLEVQQNSNTTYRIFDWNRVGADGKPRELHLDQALQVMKWRLGYEPISRPEPAGAVDGAAVEHIIRNEYFEITRLDVADRVELASIPGSFQVLFVEEGEIDLTGGGRKEAAPAGTTWLIPAALESVRMEPEGPAKVIRIHLPV